MSIFGEVAKGLGGIFGEVVRQATGKKQTQHRKQYNNLKRYSVDELTHMSKHFQDLMKESRKK
jgi:hypothetical protein